MKLMILNFIFTILPYTSFFKTKVKILNLFGFEIHKNARICGGVKFYGRGQLTIGDDTFIGIGVKFILSPKANIIIGNNCDIAPFTILHTGSHVIGSKFRRAGQGLSEKIIIGDGCWIGFRCNVLGGVFINSGTIIATGSTVLPDQYPSNVLLAGVPAKVKKTLD